MRIRAFAAAMFLLLAIGPTVASAQQLVFDPARVSGAPGQVVMVKVTPQNAPEGTWKVFVGVDRAAIAGRLTVVSGGVEVSPKGPSGAFMPVRLRLRIEPGASGDIPVTVKYQPLKVNESATPATALTLMNAFVVSVAGTPAPAVAQPPATPAGNHPPAPSGAQWSLPLPAVVDLKAGQTTQVRLPLAQLGNWNGSIQVRVTPPAGVTVEPATATIRPSDRALSLSVRTAGNAQPLAPGSDFFRLQLRGEFNGVPLTRDEQLKARITPSAPPAPAMPVVPIGPVTTSYVTPEIAGMATRVERQTQHLDGLAATLKAGAQTGVPAEIAASQAAFLQLNDVIIQQLRNPVGLIGTNEVGDPELDPQVLADFIEATGIFERDAERRQAMHQMAALGGPGLLPIINYETEIERPQLGQPVRWSEYSNIEALLVKILLRRMAEQIQPGTEQMREIMGKIDEGIEKLGGEEAEGFKKAKMLFRPLALAGSLVTIADIAGKAVLALTPNEITSFYTLINDTPREPGSDPVVINVGQEMPIKVLILTRSPGGTIVTPSEVAGWIWDNMPEKTKEKVAEKTQIPGMKGQMQDDVKKWLTEKVTSNPTVKAWIDSANKAFDIPAFNGTPVEVNSTRVIEMTSRDESKLEIVARPDGNRKRFFMIGRRETAIGEAGYQFGLRESTFLALKDADKTKFGLNNIRANVTVQKPLTCSDTGKSCVPTSAEEKYNSAEYTEAGAQYWRLVCGASQPPQPGRPTRPAGPCQCECAFLAPR